MSVTAIPAQSPRVNTAPRATCCGRFSLDWDLFSNLAAVISLISSIAAFIFYAQHHFSIIARGVVRSVVSSLVGIDIGALSRYLTRSAVRNFVGGLLGSLVYRFFSGGEAETGSPAGTPDVPLPAEPSRANFERLLAAAENGDVNAQVYIANYYGRGVQAPANINEAVRWCKRAAKQQHAEAQYSTAMSCALGRGELEQNYYKAIKWFQRAGENGNIEALNKLGDFLCVGILHDYENGFAAYQVAAAQNDPEGICNVGCCFATGWGTDRDLQKALECFKRAEELEYAPARIYAEFYKNMQAAPQDLKCTFTLDPDDDLGRIYCDQDVVSIAEEYGEDGVDCCRVLGYSGLDSASQERLQELVNQQDYIEVLRYVWTENDKEKVIKFLEPYAHENHPILMLELSRALCQQTRSSGDLESALWWYLWGMLYATLDIECNSDPTTSRIFDVLARAYHPNKVISLDRLEAFFAQDERFIPEMHSLFQNLTVNAFHPSPKWAIYHGASAFARKSSLLPQEDWNHARSLALQKFIEERLPLICRSFNLKER